MQGTQTLVMTKIAPAHKENLLNEIGRDFQTQDRQGLHYIPHKQEAATEDVMILHPSTSLGLREWSL